jgi:hypothetical protein
MKMLSPDELRDLREDIASLGLPDDRQDELIRLVDSIIISIIDQEFGWSPVQISLSARANHAFSHSDSCPRVIESGIFCQGDADNDGAAKPERSADQFAP